MWAKLRTYKLLLLLGLSGVHSIIQTGLCLQVHTFLVNYKLRYNSINDVTLICRFFDPPSPLCYALMPHGIIKNDRNMESNILCRFEATLACLQLNFFQHAFILMTDVIIAQKK